VLKSIDCGALRADHDSEEVTVAGWVHRRRDHGGLIFIDLRDSTGLVQVVFQPETADTFTTAERFRSEWVVQVKGKVQMRPNGTLNPNLATGEVEIIATSTTVFSASKTPPFDVSQDGPVDEALRLRYRYLDLRRAHMRENLRLRHRILKYIRDYLDDRAFIEVETPILIKSTPEGARDYLVPSRVHPGSFYALPQSPQQLKQLLMVAGMDRYFQIARCFRDEDLRADRQPEFTQLDLEMAFVEPDDVIELMVDLYVGMAKELAPQKNIILPVPHISYANAMSRFGSDKPDLRYGLELADLTDIIKDSEFNVFAGAVREGGVVKGIAAPGIGDITRRQVDELVSLARTFGAGGLVTIAIDASAASVDALTLEQVRTPARALSLDEIKAIATKAGATPGDLVLIAAGPQSKVEPVLGQLRGHMAQRLGLADPNTLAFCVITEFPLLEWKEEEQRWHAMHHPFTAPLDDQWDLLKSNPGAVIAKAYDLAANGSELAGGSVRIFQRERQESMFNVLGYAIEEVDELFGHLLEAFEFGAPPHGGFAGGIDRLVVTLSNHAESIRDAMAFPKTQAGVDPLFGSPSPVTNAQLNDLRLALVPADNDS